MNYEAMSKEELIEFIKNNESVTGKYGLVWDKEKEPEKIVVDCDKNIPILKENNKIIINNKGKNNLLINGDNFHSLNVLNYTHKGQIDVIYIDPPYNTGNKDFMYNDKFVDLDDGYRHSKWINFMDKRLRLAKDLLTDKGVIFISIDDNEYAQLRLLCDKLFGENNFIQNFLWNKSSGGSSLSKYTRTDYEYVLCYAKNINNIDFEFLGSISEGMGDSSLINKPNKYTKLLFKTGTIHFTNSNDTEFVLKAFKGEDFELHDDLIVHNGVNDNDVSISCRWKWSQDNLNNELSKNTKIISKTRDLRLRYIKDNKGSIIKPTKSITTLNNVGFTVTGSSELTNILGKTSFSYPKPVSLIKFLIRMVTYDKPEAIILDFFAGSGTTGQAVLELNKEDNGNRQFIICTNNENSICDEVTIPRIKTVITGIRPDKSKYSDGLLGSLKVYDTDFVENSNNRDQLYFDLTEKCIPMLCIKEDCFVKYKATDEYMIFTNEESSKFTCIYYSLFGEKEEEFFEELKKINQYKAVYKFALGSDIDTSKFDNIINYSIEPIPYKIVELYKKIVKMSRED